MSNAAIALPRPLHEGDQLDTAEFMHRWEAMPDLHRAELLGGDVYMASRVSATHSDVDTT